MSACVQSPQKKDLNAAKRLQDQGKNKAAVLAYEKTFKKFPDTEEGLAAARAGSQLALIETKDYDKAVEFHKHIVLYSPDPLERIRAQRQMADIYYERLNNYGQASVAYNRLLQLQLPAKEAQHVRMNLAKSYFYLNHFVQAQSEINILLESELTDQLIFGAKILRGNIYLAEKKIDDAIKTFEELMGKYPDQAKEEQLGLTLAVCYEEKHDYKRAQAVLMEIRENYPKPDFIDHKIRRLAEKEKNLPGAGGLRK